MPQLAIPRSVADAYRQLADARRQASPMPGHIFSLYLPMWNDNWERAGDDARRQALEDVRKASMGRLPEELIKRQSRLAGMAKAEAIEAKALSPFVTGIGEEHAVENGFAFLNPYGVPYLAGSGVKGVIRRAAEELAAKLNPDGAFGWTHARVMWLFGYEDGTEYIEALDAELSADDETAKEANDLLKLLDKDAGTFSALSPDKTHFMGALSFWDVIIDGKLGIDILTPHYGHYYQGDEPPHDAGQPVPNPFLVVAPEARFTFHITCAEHRLPKSLRGDTWRELIRAAFNHAFEWGGFGAKTAVGYGALETPEIRQKREAEAKAAKPLEAGDEVIVVDHPKYEGRKGKITNINRTPDGKTVIRLKAIDDKGRLKGSFAPEQLKRPKTDT